MQNNDLIGKVVLSKAGRDKNHLYIVVRKIHNDYVLVADGNIRTINKPKKKNVKHIEVEHDINEEIKLSILNDDKSTDLKIKRLLKLKGIVKEG